MNRIELKSVLLKTCEQCLDSLTLRVRTPWKYGEDWDVVQQPILDGRYIVVLTLCNATPVEQALNNALPYIEYQLRDEYHDIVLQDFTTREDFVSYAVEAVKL